MSSSPPEVALRPLGPDDAEAIASLIREIEAACRYPASTSAAEVAEWWSRASLPDSSWAAGDAASIDAASWIEPHGEAAEGTVVLPPRSWDEGLAVRFLRLCEERARALGSRVIRQHAYAAEAELRALLETDGYRDVRRFYLMARQLDARPEPPDPPAGIEITTFAVEDAEAFHAVLTDAFADEWGFVPMAYEEWFARRVSGRDTSFWFVARAGASVTGVLRGDPEARGGGFVGALGVARAWRGRGIGEALLRHAFAAWYEAGQRRVSLGVDSENPTGATRLYERVGMHVEFEDVVYEKELT